MKVNVNFDNVNEKSYQIKSTADYFQVTPLVPNDSKTTISANQNSKNSYNSSQKLIDYFGDAISVDADNIKGMGLSFKEIDEANTNLIKMGVNGTVIEQSK